MNDATGQEKPVGRETRRDGPHVPPPEPSQPGYNGSDRPPTARDGTRRPPTARDGDRRPPTAREDPISAEQAPDGRAHPGGSGYGIVLPDDLARDYAVVGDLSTGGEATVAVVQHRDTGQRKVVKIYRQGIVLPEAVGAKVGTADPRHVLPMDRWIYRGWATPRFVEVMDFLDAGSLEDLLATSREGIADLARAILTEITDALDYVHTKLAVAHRDIKPANVLIRCREPLDLVLADLGITAELDEIRRSRRETSGGVKGTLVYQSPETLNDRDAGRPRDWWALGMTMCEVLTGQHPFKDSEGNVLRDEGSIRTAITMGRIDLSIVTDARWNLLCRGLLTHEPADRWGATQIRQWLDGQSPAVVDSRPSPATSRPVPRFRFAGRRFDNPVDLASHMVTNWDEAVRLFVSKPECDALRTWIRDDLHDTEIETNLLTPTGGNTPVIDARVIAFTTHYLGADEVIFRGARITSGELAKRLLGAGATWEQDPILGRLEREVMAALVESQYNPEADQRGQSGEYHALLRLSRYAAEVDREIKAASAGLVRATAGQVAGVDIGADVRNAMPRRVDRARAVARAALVSEPSLSRIRTELSQLDRRRPAWFAELCADAGDTQTWASADPAAIARTSLAFGIGDLAEVYERARVDAEASAERRHRERVAAEAKQRRRAERGERLGVAGIAAIGAVVSLIGLIAHKWAAPKTNPSKDWLENASYTLLHWPSAQVQDVALSLGIAGLIALALAAGLSTVDLRILRTSSYCGCAYVGVCVLPMIIILLGYAILAVIGIAVVVLIAMGLAGAAGG